MPRKGDEEEEEEETYDVCGYRLMDECAFRTREFVLGWIP